MRKVTDDIMKQRNIFGNLMDNGVRYYRTLPSISTPEGAVYSWEKTFASSDKKKVEDDLSKFGYLAEWTDNNSLKYFYNMTTIKSHPITGEQVRMNSNYAYFVCNEMIKLIM